MEHPAVDIPPLCARCHKPAVRLQFRYCCPHCGRFYHLGCSTGPRKSKSSDSPAFCYNCTDGPLVNSQIDIDECDRRVPALNLDIAIPLSETTDVLNKDLSSSATNLAYPSRTPVEKRSRTVAELDSPPIFNTLEPLLLSPTLPRPAKKSSVAMANIEKRLQDMEEELLRLTGKVAEIQQNTDEVKLFVHTALPEELEATRSAIIHRLPVFENENVLQLVYILKNFLAAKIPDSAFLRAFRIANRRDMSRPLATRDNDGSPPVIVYFASCAARRTFIEAKKTKGAVQISKVFPSLANFEGEIFVNYMLTPKMNEVYLCAKATFPAQDYKIWYNDSHVLGAKRNPGPRDALMHMRSTSDVARYRLKHGIHFTPAKSLMPVPAQHTTGGSVSNDAQTRRRRFQSMRNPSQTTTAAAPNPPITDSADSGYSGGSNTPRARSKVPPRKSRNSVNKSLPPMPNIDNPAPGSSAMEIQGGI